MLEVSQETNGRENVTLRVSAKHVSLQRGTE